MSLFSNLAVTSAVQPAVDSAVDPVDLVNTPVGEPTQERYPGAVDPTQYTDAGQTESGGVSGPPYGSWGAEPFTETLPEQAPGGGYQDTSWMTGHDAPSVPWDSNAGPPFAPSGAVNPELHAEDTGAVFIQEHVVPAATGRLTRHTMVGQTYNKIAETQDAKISNAPNGRQNLDQQQWQSPIDDQLWTIPYAERPIQNNLAYESTGINPTNSPYTPSGNLPDRSVYDYAAVAYEAPADPRVATTQPANDSGIGGGWV